MINWHDLELLDADNDRITNVSTRTRYLQEYRQSGSMAGAFFDQIGAAHEDAEDASTWGPQSPDGVDWTGFGD